MNAFTTQLRVMIAAAAMEVIIRESKQYQERETGGILVGRRLNASEFLIVAATDAGPEADHQAHTFAPDADFANQELQRLRGIFTDVDYIGVWHKHPAFLDHPSGGDLKQARKILADTDYKINGELLAPIAVIIEGQVNFKMYYLTDRLPDFVALPYTVIPDEDPRLTAVQPQPALPAWYDSPPMQRELVALRTTYEDMQVAIDGESLFVTVISSRSPKTKIHLIFIDPYPAISPQVVIETDGLALPFPENVPMDVLESGMTLAQWVDKIEQALLMPEPTPPVTKEMSNQTVTTCAKAHAQHWIWPLLLAVILMLLLIYKRLKKAEKDDGL